MSKSNNDSSGCGCLLLVAVVVLWFGVNQFLNWQAAQPFQSVLPQAASLCQTAASRGSSSASVRSGPILLVDILGGGVHEQFRQLDARVRATDAAGLATLVCLKSSDMLVGHYTDGAAGYQIYYQVWLVDFKTGRNLGSSSFTGGRPPSSKSGSGSRSGSAPNDELRRWIENLPIQTAYAQ